MAEEEKINLELIKPTYPLEQVVFVPVKNKVVETKIIRYEVQVIKENDSLLGILSNYYLDQMVRIRRGTEQDLVYLVKECDFYVDREKAEAASKFLEVKADEETWKLAIGDRKVEDEDSPYDLDNCGLPRCCANISEARNILLYCQEEGGLIAHDRDNLLSLLLDRHDLEFEKQEPIGKIYTQLGIK
ncbi:hypothetical protein GOV06_01415 [Candidatus Woesearchaeota archaeon]|nr:hypothetical protein [Candidatus Woesearchaeota archaeon]